MALLTPCMKWIFFIKRLLLNEFMNSYNFGTKKEWSFEKIYWHPTIWWIFWAFITFMKTLGLKNEGFQSKATAKAYEIIFSLFSVKLKLKWQKYFNANSERIWPHFMMYCPHSVLSPAKTRREMCISIDLSSKHLDSKRDWPILPYFSSLGTVPSSELADFLKVDGWRIWWKPSFML